MTSKLSFTVRPPPQTFDTDTPEQSRPGSASPDSDPVRVPHRPATSSPLASASTRPKPGKRQWESYTAQDSSDEDEPETEEMITGFDAMGVQRLDESKNKPKGPLVIPAQKNRDWRAESMARKRQAMNGFVPDGARVATGKDGSQGGMGTRGTINDGPQLSGLIVNAKREEVKEEAVDIEMDEVKEEPAKEEPMDEDQRALRALLSGSGGDDKPKVELAAIHLEDGPAWHQAHSEVDAFKEDLARRPDESTLADYERVPIELFGAAMLRGMGHVPGKAASKSGAGRIEPYIPESRPALLGIGAKPRPQDENEDKGKKRFVKPDKRYVPVVKAERNGSGSSSRRTSRSRSGSPSRGSRRDRDSDRRESYRDERRDRDRERDRDRDGDRDRERDRDGRREKDKERERDRDRDRDRRDRDYDSDRTRDRRRDYDSDRDRDRDRERRRDYDSDRDRRRDRDRDGRRR